MPGNGDLTVEDFIDDITGETGADGATGADGDTGATGQSAFEIWEGLDGNDGKDISDFLDSLKGDTGASAYEVWKGLAGNEDKTEAEFIEAITGEDGIAGATGSDGASAFDVWQALPGNGDLTVEDFIDDITGETGADGATGADGDTGATGQSAFEIWEGLDGNDGKDISDFLDSLKGDTGASAYEVWKGLAGNEDKTEAEFIEAITGEDGIAGATGSDGASAFDVWQALPGNGDLTVEDFIDDITGETGADGATGADGDTGATGQSAFEIWEGLDGNDGKDISDFLDSLKGDTGASAYEVWKGLAGNEDKTEAEFIEAITGEDGIAGATGSDGASAFDVWQALPGNGDLTVEDFIDDITGETGADGATGADGDTGATGQSAFEIWEGLDGNDGKDISDFLDSLKGDTGASAYEVWKGLAGNEDKTEAEFIEAITGEDGIAGATGSDGASAFDVWQALPGNGDLTVEDFIDDITGETGADGATGADGDTGATGQSAFEIWEGLDGNDGKDISDFLDSLKGDTGASAYEVWKGLAGNEDKTEAEFIEAITGEDGIAGATGSDGASAFDVWQALPGNGDLTVEDFIDDITGETGADGATPEIGANGNWFIDGVDTGFPAQGQDGATGDTGAAGQDGQDGDNFPFVNILEGDDAYISGSDLNEEGKVDVAIALPDDAEVDDTLTVNDVDTTITQDMIDNGFITSLDVPDSGTLFVRATVEYADGSISGTGKDFARVGIIARDDADELELGDLQIAQIPVYTNETYDLLNLAEATDGSEGTLPFTVSESSNGTVDIEVSQTALVTVADAINIEIYDSNGDRVYVGTNNGDTPLVGNAVGLEFLGLTGNDTLTATVSGLEPGEYRIVVRNDESALEDLVNELTLADLGEAGVVLGPDNQDAVLDAVESALNDSILGPLGSVLGTTVRGVLEGVLDLTTDIGVGELVNIITGNAVINGLLGGAVDPLLDAIADALLSNTLTLLETTNITATLTEFDYADDTAITGNVIDPDGGIEGEDGEDTVTSTTTLTAITSNNVSESVPTSTEVGGVEVFTIVGQYGVLVIDETGEYTYTANGDYASAGQTETFTYTVANGIGSDMAELVIELAVDTTPPDAPTVNTPIADDDVVNGMEAEDGFAITGTGDFGDDVTLTNETGDVIGTAIVDISGNWSVLVDQADVDAMGEDSETITVIATDPFGNVSAPAAVVFDIDTVAPAAPTLNVNEAGTEITGASEADAFVEIDADGDGTVDYNTTADGHGNYVIDSSAAPLINGETVTATATDAAGNESDPSSVEVPVKLVANDDPAVAGLDVTPTSSTTTSNDDSNLKDTETSALNLLGIGSFEVSVDFTVAANNIGSAEVNFSSTGIANVLDNGSLVLQKKDEDDKYVNVDSAASATGLLNVLDLLGDGVPDGYTLSGLTAGDYRLVGSVNPAVGLLTTGTLEVVTLTETSITEIDAIQAVNATGNVIDENDVSTDDTVVTTVTFDGNDTPIIASGDTSITGTYGTLLINADGDYTYTPTENASGIGKEDVFSYTIIDTETGSTDSATLTVSIESDYPAVDFPIDAVDDFATAELVVHPETTIHTVDEAASAGTLSDGVSEVEDTFTISNGSEGSAVFSVDSSGAAALTGGMHFTLEKQTGTGWIEIADEDDGNPPLLADSWVVDLLLRWAIY